MHHFCEIGLQKAYRAVKMKLREEEGRVDVKQERRRASSPIVPLGSHERGGGSFTLITIPGLPIAFPNTQWLQ